ncbi:hydrogenase/urease maturation nickel metallochaperone HypA, partial [Persephonella sp.]
KCEDCQKKFTIEDNRFICPFCSGYNLSIIDGEDMYLISLELEV